MTYLTSVETREDWREEEREKRRTERKLDGMKWEENRWDEVSEVRCEEGERKRKERKSYGEEK